MSIVKKTEGKQNDSTSDSKDPNDFDSSFSQKTCAFSIEFQDSSPIQKTHIHKESTKAQACLNLFKGYIGSGILALPYSFKQAGCILGTLVFSTIALIMIKTMGLLFQVADKVGSPSIQYQDLAQIIFGVKGMYIVKFFLLVFQFGCCVSYIIFFLKFFEHVFQPNQSSNTLLDLCYLGVALIIIFFMNAINNVKVFAKISFIANIFMISTLIAIIVENIIDLSDGLQSNSIELFNVSKLTQMIGISVYSFESIGIAFPIRATFHNNQTPFKQSFQFTSILVIILYVLFSILGVVSQENDLGDIILFSLPRRVDAYYFQITYALALAMTYPLQLLPCLQMIEGENIMLKLLKIQDKNYKIRRFVFRALVTLIIFICAYFVPRFSLILNLVGAFAGTSLQFIFPIVMHLIVFSHSLTISEKLRNYIFLVFGAVGGIASTLISSADLFNL